MRKIWRLIFVTIIPVLLLASCRNNINNVNNAKTKLLELISTNKKVVCFGKIDLKGLIDKSEVDKLPKVGVLFNTLKDIYRYTKIEDSIYFANEIIDEESINSYFLVDITNRDSLVDFFNGMGLNFEEKDNRHVYSSSQFSIVINDLSCVLGTNNAGNDEITKRKTFEILGGKKISIDTSMIPKNILNTNSDIVFGISLASPLHVLNDTLTMQNAFKLLNNSFIQSHIQFNKGNIQLITKNIFSSDLLENSFFKTSDGLWAKDLITGNTSVAYALNIDIVKCLNFIATINPALNEQFSYLQFFKNLPMKNMVDFQRIFDGRMALMCDEYRNTQNEFGDMRLFLGLGQEGQNLIDLYRLFVEESDFILNEVSNGVLISTIQNNETTKQIIDNRFKEFGKKGFSFLIDFTQFNSENVPEGINLEYISDLNYATFDMDFQGSKLLVYLKDSRKNVLTILSQSIVKSFFQNENIKENGDVI